MAALHNLDDEPRLRRERDAWKSVVHTLRFRGIRSGSALWDRDALRTAEDKLRNAEYLLAQAEAAKEEAA